MALTSATPLASGSNGGTLVQHRNRPAIARVAVGLRGRDLLALDTVGIVLAAYAALAIRYERLVEPGAVVGFLPALLVLLGVRIVANIRFGLYSRRWRFASVPDLQTIVAAVVIGSLLSIGLFYGASLITGGEWAPGLPRSFWAGEMLLSGAFIAGLRFGIRRASDVVRPAVPVGRADRRATLLYGAGHCGVIIARWAQRKPSAGVRPVGFLDDDRSLAGGLIAGIRVFGGLDWLERAAVATGAQTVLITMPSAPGPAVRRVVEAAMALGLEVRTVPSITDLLDGTVNTERIRAVRVEDLLRRPIVSDHVPSVEGVIRDGTVVITGAGGSIGSELARQVCAIGPRRLVLVDRAESPLYTIQREVETIQAHSGRGMELRVHLANVASRAAMERLISAEAPNVIFHAAAYKHVPMMEEHASDAVDVNIGGTLALLDAAVSAGVQRFVFVSTDKAVRPSSVMGATKRVAEMLVADAALRSGRPYVSVRFGNVLGSTGSVVPILQDQLEKGEPLTITHPDITRFFMSIPEAAWLILDAAALGQKGDLFVLDMGDPVRIMDLARDLVRLSGRDPDSQPFKIVGLRPGEKLHEELFYAGESVERTPSSKVFRVAATPPPPGIRNEVTRMLARATGADEPALREALLAYAWGLEPAVGGQEAAGIAPPLGEIAIDVLGVRAATSSRAATS